MVKNEHLKNIAFAQSMEQYAQKVNPISQTDQFSEVDLPEEQVYQEFLIRLENGRQKQQELFKSVVSNLQVFNAGLQLVEELMSISGKVDPVEIKKVVKEEQEKVLNALASDCIVNSADTITWMLNQKKRVEVLNRLLESGRLISFLDGPLPSTDTFGHWLREVLKRGGNLPIEKLNEKELLSVICVLETLATVNISKPEISRVKSFIQTNTLLADYAILSTGFIGRERELEELQSFLDDGKKGLSYSDWEGLLLTGLGGVGKSTLLAKFTGLVMKENRATTVILDFDRPGIDPRDTAWLEIEISRQVGKQYQQLREDLFKSRERAFYSKDDYGSESHSESSRSIRSVIDEVRERLWELDKIGQPFLLVLDTMEEATQRFLVGKLQEWIDDLCSVLHPMTVKVIFSGRLYDQQRTSITSIPKVAQSIELEEFESQIAISFLKSQGLIHPIAVRIVQSDFLPRRPLELKLLAKLLLEGATTLEELEIDFVNLGKSDAIKQLFVGVIYQRVLRRMGGDELIGKIAYPGLILRYITPEIVQQVLQPALKLSQINKEKAKELVNKIASFNWLAYIGKNGEIYHRKDLRRSMLKLMIAQEPEKVAAIRLKAIEYFGEKKLQADKSEVLYHRLMMVTKPENTESFEMIDLKLAFDDLSPDLVDLPRLASVMVHYASDQTIHEDDIELLPDKFFSLGYHSVAATLVSNRQFLRAFQVYRRAKSLGALSDSRDGDWQNEMLFATGQWDEVRLQDPSLSTNISGMRRLYNYIFPTALWMPEKLDRNIVEQLLVTAVREDHDFFRNGSDPQAITLLNRISYCVSNLYVDQPSPKRDDFNNMLYNFQKTSRSEYRLPANEKSHFILQTLFSYWPVKNYKLGVSLLKFDLEWINRLTAFTTEKYHSLLSRTAKIFERVDTAVYTCRTLLSAIDGAKDRRRWQDIIIPLEGIGQEIIYDLLKGPNPLFRDPCRYAILEAFPSYASRLKLAVLIQSVIKVPLLDLIPETFGNMMEQNTELALEPTIEVIDRSWQLGSFLMLAAAEMPDAPKLKLVGKAYQRWEQAFEKLVLQK